LYEPQLHTQCGRLGSLQAGQVVIVGFSSLLLDEKRRILRRLRDDFFFGTAMVVLL